MSLQQVRQSLAAPFQDASRALDQAHLAQKVWLTSHEAMAYTDRLTLAAWYAWRNRRGIVTDGAGRVLRKDVDRALARKRKPYTRRTSVLSTTGSAR